MQYYKFDSLLQKEGWMSPAYIGVDKNGIIHYLSKKAPADKSTIENVEGFALPGFQNTHSHAFQYAMAGLAENHPVGVYDDFWTWREAMYECALSVNPDQAQAIACALYSEMLRHGYTHVAEFHYLHHDKDGKPYANLAEMGERMLAAAKKAGIKITLIPVFYQMGGFGTKATIRQRRFISHNVPEYFKLLEASKKCIKHYNDAYFAFGVHSLRAVQGEDIIETFNQGPKDLPFHLHISEQIKEVTDCLAYYGKRPVEWLFENLPVDERFHLVHATHLNDKELNAIANSKAVVALCPSTEGNLGDGIFRMKDYVESRGRWSLGTDSHIGLNPLEEFRILDYRQRLVSHKRNSLQGDAAKYLVNEEIESGRRAMGLIRSTHFEIGHPLDAVVYDAQSYLLGETSEKNRLATIVYTADASHALGTLVNGKWAVKNQHSVNEKEIKTCFFQTIKELQNR